MFVFRVIILNWHFNAVSREKNILLQWDSRGRLIAAYSDHATCLVNFFLFNKTRSYGFLVILVDLYCAAASILWHIHEFARKSRIDHSVCQSAGRELGSHCVLDVELLLIRQMQINSLWQPLRQVQLEWVRVLTWIHTIACEDTNYLSQMNDFLSVAVEAFRLETWHWFCIEKTSLEADKLQN